MSWESKEIVTISRCPKPIQGKLIIGHWDDGSVFMGKLITSNDFRAVSINEGIVEFEEDIWDWDSSVAAIMCWQYFPEVKNENI